MFSDNKIINCNEEYELQHILRRYGKRQKSDNIQILKEHCTKFKLLLDYAPHKRDSFYRYIKDIDLLSELK